MPFGGEQGEWLDDEAESVLVQVGLFDPLLMPIEPLRTFAPSKLCFCLNFSSQLDVNTFSLPSGQPQVLAKKRAFSLIISSFNGCPRRW